MIPVNDALEMIMATAKDFGTETVPLLYSTGRILRQAVKADRDFPAYDRVTMDGIAINSNSISTGNKNIFNRRNAGCRATTFNNEGTGQLYRSNDRKQFCPAIQMQLYLMNNLP